MRAKLAQPDGVADWSDFRAFFAVSPFVAAFYPRAVSSNVFRHSYRVNYADCTVGNHVYYARYLEILEIARGEFFRSLGRTFLEWQGADIIFPVVECHLRYKAPARYDDVLAVEVWVTTALRARLNFGYRVLNADGTLILEAETLHVCTDFAEKPKRLPEELIDKVKPHLRPETGG